MILTIKGEIIELAEKEKITFSFESLCNGLDKKKLSRTQSFKIPKTTKNLQIFGFSNRPEVFGAEMRVSFDAILTHGAGQIKGILYINDATGDTFNAIFLYGECLPLKRLKEAGKLSDIFYSNLTKVLRKGTTDTMSANLGVFVYFNGESDDPTKWHYPAVKWSYLLSQSMSALDLNYNSTAFTNSYLSVLRSQNGTTQIISTSTENVLNYWSGEFNSNYFVQDTIVVDDYGTSTTYNVLRCIQACRFQATETNTNYNGAEGYLTGLFVMRDVDYVNENDVNEFFTKKIAQTTTRRLFLNANLEVGDCIFYGQFKAVGSYGVEIQTLYYLQPLIGTIYGNGTKLALTQDSLGYLMGTFALQENMPDLTAFDLINLIAELKGGVAYFDEANDRFDIFDWDFDGKNGAIVDVDNNLIKVTSVERKSFDYAQNQIFTLKQESNRYYNAKAVSLLQKTYTTQNELITEESKVELKGTGVNVYTSARHSNTLVAAINSEEYNDTYSASQLKEGDNSIIGVLGGWSSYGLVVPAEVKKNTHLQTICDLATKIKVEVTCDDIMWQKVSRSFTRYTFRGGWYFCLNATYSKPKVTLILQRYK